MKKFTGNENERVYGTAAGIIPALRCGHCNENICYNYGWVRNDSVLYFRDMEVLVTMSVIWAKRVITKQGIVGEIFENCEYALRQLS